MTEKSEGRCSEQRGSDRPEILHVFFDVFCVPGAAKNVGFLAVDHDHDHSCLPCKTWVFRVHVLRLFFSGQPEGNRRPQKHGRGKHGDSRG